MIFCMLEMLSSMDCIFCFGVGSGGEAGLLSCVVEILDVGESGLLGDVSDFWGEGIVGASVSGDTLVVFVGNVGRVIEVWRLGVLSPTSLFKRDFDCLTGTKISLFFLPSLYKTMLPSLISWIVRCPTFSPCLSHLFPSATVFSIASDFSGASS